MNSIIKGIYEWSHAKKCRYDEGTTVFEKIGIILNSITAINNNSIKLKTFDLSKDYNATTAPYGSLGYVFDLTSLNGYTLLDSYAKIIAVSGTWAAQATLFSNYGQTGFYNLTANTVQTYVVRLTVLYK